MAGTIENNVIIGVVSGISYPPASIAIISGNIWLPTVLRPS